MKQKQDLFNLFRESRHKLDEAPSPQVWKRLENRLDARRSRHSNSLYRVMAMAAGVLLLIGVFSLLPALEQQNTEAPVAMNTPPSEMEDLIVEPDANQNIIKVVEFSRQYQDRMVQPIEEGDSRKKLVPSKIARSSKADETSNTLLDSISSQNGEG